MEKGLCANIILLMTLMILMFHHGVSYGKHDQSTRLMALRDAKMNGGDRVDQGEFEWKKVLFDVVDDKHDGDHEVGDMEDDLIKGGLPGQPFDVEFKQFSGYVSVDKSNGRSLFYYFVEAVDNPSSKPLVLWLNGGPGCSSLGIGAMIEIGPFGVKPDGQTLYRRRISWNNVANVLFLESPAGVGFSYSNNTNDYKKTGDKSTARDTFEFFKNWYKRFPQYRDRDLYITGESYAGFYIPEIAEIIMEQHLNPFIKDPYVINLQGIMIGNGIMNDDTDVKGQYEYLWTHAMISDETYEGIKQNCITEIYTNIKCRYFLEQVEKEVGEIDFYNIYGPRCRKNTSKLSRKFHQKTQAYDPCETNYVHAYLNLPHVQQALHANLTNLPYEWALCSDTLNEYWTDSPSNMFHVYQNLLSTSLRILLYSGDVDAVVSVTSTRLSINALSQYSDSSIDLRIIEPWHPWLDETNEVGGYRVIYDQGLTFATVRGAGHEVPKYMPSRALTLLKYFLSQK